VLVLKPLTQTLQALKSSVENLVVTYGAFSLTSVPMITALSVLVCLKDVAKE
jgi:hypothetical protein